MWEIYYSSFQEAVTFTLIGSLIIYTRILWYNIWVTLSQGNFYFQAKCPELLSLCDKTHLLIPSWELSNTIFHHTALIIVLVLSPPGIFHRLLDSKLKFDHEAKAYIYFWGVPEWATMISSTEILSVCWSVSLFPLMSYIIIAMFNL